MGFRLVPESVTLNDLEQHNAIILRYYAEFGSFRVRKSGWLAINRFSPEICYKVHQLSTTDALCSSR